MHGPKVAPVHMGSLLDYNAEIQTATLTSPFMHLQVEEVQEKEARVFSAK